MRKINDYKNEKKDGIAITLTVLCAVVALIVVSFIVVAIAVTFVLKKDDKTATTEISVSDTAKTEEAYDNKNAVQNNEPAPQEYQPEAEWITETAVLNGRAPDTENNDFMRNNIHLTNVEDYVANTIRPIYYEIMEKVPQNNSGNERGISWYSAADSMQHGGMASIVCVKYNAGSGGNKYERRYYFDCVNDELIFAFKFLGNEEYRQYFYKNSIIRYIGPDKKVTDNPTQDYILNEAQNSITEAYVYWD